MENYENIYNSICRLCLSYSDRKKMVSLIDEISQDGLTPYAKAVSTFTNINLSKQDLFPGNMCSKCLLLLKQAINFKFMVETNDNCLKQLKNSIYNDGQNFREKIVEYTMLNFYFPGFKVIKKCFKTKKSSKEQSNTEIQLRKYEKVMENRVTSTNCSEDENFDTPSPESDTEKQASYNSIQDEDRIKHLNDSNMFKFHKTVTNQEELENKESNPKSKCRAKKKRSYLQRNLVCNICNKVMANQVTLRGHMMRHTGGRFICEHCGKRYPVYNALQIHQLTKHGTGPYLQCSHCPFKAPGKIKLTEHERIHTGERPFACDKCGLTFRRRAIWKKHLVHHSEKKVQCPHCPKKFYLRSDMVGHSNSVHERLYVYLCSECGATYNKGGSVRQHMAKLHGIPREKQGKIARVKKGGSTQQK